MVTFHINNCSRLFYHSVLYSEETEFPHIEKRHSLQSLKRHSLTSPFYSTDYLLFPSSTFLSVFRYSSFSRLLTLPFQQKDYYFFLSA